MNKTKTSVPLGVLLIGIFYVIGAIALLIFLFMNPAQTASNIAERHGLPASTGKWILPVVAGIGLLIAYGLISLSRWGYVFTILYLIYFGSVNGFLYIEQASWTYLGNVIWSLLVIFYLILIRKCFLGKNLLTEDGHKAQVI